MLTQRLSFAKTKSDAVAKADGTFVERSAKERQKKNAAERGVPHLRLTQCYGTPLASPRAVLRQRVAACRECLQFMKQFKEHLSIVSAVWTRVAG